MLGHAPIRARNPSARGVRLLGVKEARPGRWQSWEQLDREFFPQDIRLDGPEQPRSRLRRRYEVVVFDQDGEIRLTQRGRHPAEALRRAWWEVDYRERINVSDHPAIVRRGSQEWRWSPNAEAGR